VKDERKDHGVVDKTSFLCEKFGASGLTAGRQAGWLADKIVLNLKFFKIIYWMKYLSFRYV